MLLVPSSGTAPVVPVDELALLSGSVFDFPVAFTTPNPRRKLPSGRRCTNILGPSNSRCVSDNSPSAKSLRDRRKAAREVRATSLSSGSRTFRSMNRNCRAPLSLSLSKTTSLTDTVRPSTLSLITLSMVPTRMESETGPDDRRQTPATTTSATTTTKAARVLRKIFIGRFVKFHRN